MTNNGQTPGGNTTTAGAVEMARRIAASMIGNPDVVRDMLAGDRDDDESVQSALAAIIETTEAAANWAIEVYGSGRPDESTDGDCIAFDLREGAHLINGKAPKP